MPSSAQAMFAYRYPRRLITIPALFILGLSALLLLPITLVAAGLLDRGRPWNRARLVLLVTGGLTIEMTGVLAAFLLWLGTGFGVFTRLIPTRRRWQLNRRLMGAYTAAVFWWIAKILGTHIEWRSRGDTITGPVVLMARHTSFFDALIPATVLSHHHGLLAHHVVTSGLRIMPCIDLIGHRFPTRFIRRTPDEDSHELVEIEQLGTHLDGRSAAVIFPEGTFRNPARFERAIDRLRRRSPEIADRAAALRHVLPPRPAGTRALLRGATSADIVVCMNTGLEAFNTLADIRASLTSDRPIVIETYTIPRSTIPEDPDAFATWLLEEYERIDAWVDAQQPQT